VRVVQGRIVHERRRDGDPEIGHRRSHGGELRVVDDFFHELQRYGTPTS